MMTTEILRYLGIAFASSVLLLVLSKVIMQFILRRQADYYLKEEYKQEELILNNAGFSINDEVETNPEGEVTEEHVHVEPQLPKPEPIEIPVFEIPLSGTEQEPVSQPEIKKPEPVPELITIPFPEPEKPQPEKAETGKIPEGVPLTKAGKPRKPSMSMKKDELMAIADWKGVALPPDATKAVILELIESAE
ncbi:MAG: hypothetical protein IJH62_02515 [Mogibacterium sp.]|nr:hypothetical protein [Mogibacterium sp.]